MEDLYVRKVEITNIQYEIFSYGGQADPYKIDKYGEHRSTIHSKGPTSKILEEFRLLTDMEKIIFQDIIGVIPNDED